MSAGVLEYLLEAHTWPGLKQSQQHQWVAYTGLALVVLGEAIRKAAMVSCCKSSGLGNSTQSVECLESQASLTVTVTAAPLFTASYVPACSLPSRLAPAAVQVTAASNFTHDIQHTKRPQHQLVTHGVYRWGRGHQGAPARTRTGLVGGWVWRGDQHTLLSNQKAVARSGVTDTSLTGPLHAITGVVPLHTMQICAPPWVHGLVPVERRDPAAADQPSMHCGVCSRGEPPLCRACCAPPCSQVALLS